MNRAIITGNITKDPEHRTTQSGISCTTFTVAVQRKFAKEEPKADFLNVVTWRTLADNVAKYTQKGSRVGIVGQIQTRQYDDKNGVRRYITEIIADEVEFLSTKCEKSQDVYKNDQNYKQSVDDLFADELAAFEPVDAEIPF